VGAIVGLKLRTTQRTIGPPSPRPRRHMAAAVAHLVAARVIIRAKSIA
jgi:hypothetical protein